MGLRRQIRVGSQWMYADEAHRALREALRVMDDEQGEHGGHHLPWYRRYLFSTDHKWIGIQYGFTALCFLPCFFLAPLAGMVPLYATAPVLILVGASMFRSVNQIDFAKIEEGLPAFLTIILIPLTFSITQGILWGFISHVVLYLFVGRRRDIHPVMYVLALISIGLLLLEHVRF